MTIGEGTGGFLRATPGLTLLPVAHESADYAREVRDFMLAHRFDCLAVPLPPSFRQAVLDGVGELPRIGAVVQREGGGESATFVPVDPCQAVVAALRIGLEERMAIAFVDLETDDYEPQGQLVPDAYALRRVPLPRFLAALLPHLPAPESGGQRAARIAHVAARIVELQSEHAQVLALCSVADWPWLREAVRAPGVGERGGRTPGEARLCRVAPETLLFVLGELPFVTGLHERRRAQLRADDGLSVDGVKELLVEARRRWESAHRLRDHHLTTEVMQRMLRYVRNLSLMDRRLTPDLYTLAVAAKQCGGDSYALSLLETARDYPFLWDRGAPPVARFAPERAELPGGDVVLAKNRLAGPPRAWRRLALRPRPAPPARRTWKMRWNPMSHCSWAPEDRRVERFGLHVRDRARAAVSEELARAEPFTSSVKDGVDIRETLRHWYEGKIWVREIPPSRGRVEAVVVLFERRPDPARYPFRMTWYGEHENESTMAFFATPLLDDLVGPSIARSVYGGFFLIFPPRAIPDVWTDPRLDFARDVGERLVAGACLHSAERIVTVVSPGAPDAAWRSLARRFGRSLVHIPLRRFSLQTTERLRRFHVLNGRHVRSWAAHFITDF